jgi:hypothetical protein
VTLRALWVTLRAWWVTLRASLGGAKSSLGDAKSLVVTLRARWVTLRARWVTLRARWVTLIARWVLLRARWVTLRARWVTLIARWVTLGARWVTLRARWVTLSPRGRHMSRWLGERIAAGRPPSAAVRDALLARCVHTVTRLGPLVSGGGGGADGGGGGGEPPDQVRLRAAECFGAGGRERILYSDGVVYRIRKWAPCSTSGPSIRLQSRGVKQLYMASQKLRQLVRLPWAADSCPWVGKLRTVLPFTNRDVSETVRCSWG